MIKLIKDDFAIASTLVEKGYEWNNIEEFSNIYFGEGTDILWKDNTKIYINRKLFVSFSILKKIDLEKVKRDIVFFREEFGTGEKNSINFIETVYYIPAQRVLTIENGWPKSFDSYNVFDPYVLKKFSENLRKFVEFDLQFQKELFISKSIKPFVFLLDRNLFYKGKLKISKKFLKKRLVIEINNREIPFMVWSSGQREFIPMLLSFLDIISEYEKYLKEIPNHSPIDLNELIIIEEPEMGLHPKALETVLIMILYLMYLDYKVVISTHSADVLELIWALKNIKESNIDDNRKINLLNKLFELNTKEFNKIWEKVLKKNYKTYYFEPVEENVFIRDISDLDPFEDKAISEWGGLISFSTKVSDILSELPYEE